MLYYVLITTIWSNLHIMQDMHPVTAGNNTKLRNLQVYTVLNFKKLKNQ